MCLSSPEDKSVSCFAQTLKVRCFTYYCDASSCGQANNDGGKTEML